MKYIVKHSDGRYSAGGPGTDTPPGILGLGLRLTNDATEAYVFEDGDPKKEWTGLQAKERADRHAAAWNNVVSGSPFSVEQLAEG